MENVTGLKRYTEDMDIQCLSWSLIGHPKQRERIKDMATVVVVKIDTECGRGAFLSAVKQNWKVLWSVRK